jgi:hypothetical protein
MDSEIAMYQTINTRLMPRRHASKQPDSAAGDRLLRCTYRSDLLGLTLSKHEFLPIASLNWAALERLMSVA